MFHCFKKKIIPEAILEDKNMEKDQPPPEPSILIKSFRCEEIESIISNVKDQSFLKLIYIDRIRNCQILTDEMMKNIETFDSDAKMEIIREQTKIMKTIVEFI